MWSLMTALATIVLFSLTYTLPGPFNPLILFFTVAAAACFGAAATYDFARWKQKRDRNASQPLREEEPHAPRA